MIELITVCSECGSDKVQEKQWVEINTNKLCGSASSNSKNDILDYWCPDCEDHVQIKQIEN